MEFKKNIRIVFIVFTALFTLLTAWIVKFAFFDADDIVYSPYNRRAVQDKYIRRGSISDKTGQIIAETLPGGTRSYPRGAVFAHPVGFSGVYSQGVENTEQSELLHVSDELSQRLGNFLSESPVTGDGIVMTLDFDIQKKAMELLDGHKGAIVVIETSTGRVLTLASSPTFDPNAVSEQWTALSSDTANSPLLNRAVSGLYPPASVFKIVTLTAAMRHMPDYKGFIYTCAGKDVFGNRELHCFNGAAHGEVDYRSAMAKSCNGYFARLAEKIGADALNGTADELLFNTELPFGLDHSLSFFNSNSADLAESAIGQGKALTTPLHICLLMSAIANDGDLLIPNYIAEYQDYAGVAVKTVPEEYYGTLFSGGECAVLKDVCREVVVSGTARQLADTRIAGKTGTAELGAGDSHGWFAGYAPYDDPEIAFVILIENIGSSSAILPMAREITDVYFGD